MIVPIPAKTYTSFRCDAAKLECASLTKPRTLLRAASLSIPCTGMYTDPVRMLQPPRVTSMVATRPPCPGSPQRRRPTPLSGISAARPLPRLAVHDHGLDWKPLPFDAVRALLVVKVPKQRPVAPLDILPDLSEDFDGLLPRYLLTICSNTGKALLLSSCMVACTKTYSIWIYNMFIYIYIYVHSHTLKDLKNELIIFNHIGWISVEYFYHMFKE